MIKNKIMGVATMQSIRGLLKYNLIDEGDIRKTEKMFQMRNNDVTKTLGYADLRYGYQRDAREC